MIPSDMQTIVDQLLKRSLDGTVNWVEAKRLGLPSRYDFAVKLPNYIIAIGLNTDNDMNSNLCLDLLNESGRTAVSADAADGTEEFEIINNLYEAARRSALKADEILSDLRARLERDESLGSSLPPPPPSEGRPGDADSSKWPF